jgi:hypothetical protein
MALQWADFPSGQHGLYGKEGDRMLDGTPWVHVHNPSTAIVADPDPGIGENGYVLRHRANADGPTGATRLALTSPHAVVGVCHNFYAPTLPAGARPFIAFLTTGNVLRYQVRVRPNGGLEILRQSTVVATADFPIILASSWNLIETLVDVVAGTVQVRKNDVPVISYTDPSPFGGTIGLVGFPDTNPGGGNFDFFSKNIVVYNGQGSNFNTFQGNVFVTDLRPNADETLGGWTPSYGTNGYPHIGSTPFNHLIATGTPNTANNIRIGDTYYRFTTGNVNAGTPAGTSANPWLVNRGSNAEQALSNLRKAINASGTPGTDYSTALTAHPTIEASGLSADKLGVWPKDGTSSAFAFAEGDANLSWLSTSGMVTDGRADDLTFIAADDTPPSPAEVKFTSLPPDVTSIRGLISITRSRKTDGGDGNLQTSLSPNGINYAVGADNPVTTASTYRHDVSEISPVTSAAWTPTEVNSIRQRYNRTV